MKKTYSEQIADLENTRAAKVGEMDNVMSKSLDEGRSTDDAEGEQIDLLGQEIKSLDKDLDRLRMMQNLNAEKAVPADGTSTKAASESRQPSVQVKNTQKLEKGIEFARYAICLAAGKGNLMQSLEIAKSRYPENENIVGTIKAAVEAGTTTDATWAAPLVQYNNFAGDFVEFLRPQTIVGRFGTDGIPGMRRIPFNVRIPAQTSGGNASWVGEAVGKPVTSFDFSTTELRWAKVAAIAVLTEELVRFSTPSAENLVRQSLADAIIARLDTDFVDPGKALVPGVSPASITNTATAIPSSGTDADAVRTDMRALWGTYIAANINPTTAVYIMSATQALALSLMVNPLGQPEFPGMNMRGGTLGGVPVIVSEYVAGDSSGGMVILANASDIYLADDGQVVVDASREASLQMDTAPTQNSATPTPTTTVSLWQTNSVGLRAERWINWAKRRPQAVTYLTGVNWGAGA